MVSSGQKLLRPQSKPFAVFIKVIEKLFMFSNLFLNNPLKYFNIIDFIILILSGQAKLSLAFSKNWSSAGLYTLPYQQIAYTF